MTSVWGRLPEVFASRMDSRFIVLDRLPVPPGTSPFRMKGHVYRKLVNEWETAIGGGLRSVLERADDFALYHFGIKGFAPGSWYDVLPIVPLTLAATELLGVPFRTYVKDRAAAHAKADLQGLYRHIVRLSSADELIASLDRLRAQYFDFGRVVALERSELAIEGRAIGIPETFVPWVIAAAEGYLAAAFRLVGTDVRLATHAPVLTHFEGGLRIVDVPFSLLMGSVSRRVSSSGIQLRQSDEPSLAKSRSGSHASEEWRSPLEASVPFRRKIV